MKVAVLTVSDRSHSGEREDRGGPALIKAALARGWVVVGKDVVPDSARMIERRLKAWCDSLAAPDLVLTTGGTGVGPRDVTPEATRAVVSKEIPGLSERMRRQGERHTLMAALSRGICGWRRRTLVMNLPGSPKGAVESLDSVAELLEHARAMIAGGDHA